MPRPPFRGRQAPQPLKFDFGTLKCPGQQELEKYAAEGRARLLAVGGARGGKSWYGTRRVLKWVFSRGGLGWVVIPDYSYGSEIVRLTNEVLAQHWEVVEDFHEHPFPRWRFKTVGQCGPAQIEIRSAYDPEQIRASTLSWGWMDEGAMSSFQAYRNLEQRVLSTRGPILVTTTPRGKNWVYEQLYVPFTKDNLRYGAASLRTVDNPTLPREEIEHLLEEHGKDSAWAKQELGGEFVTFEGLVYAVFDVDRHVVGQAPEKFRGVWAGLDWWFAPDPAALVVLGEDTQGVWWVLHEIVVYRHSIPELSRLVDGAVRQFGIKTIWADPSRPDPIRQMQATGLPVAAARKLREVNVGVQKVARLLERDRLKVLSHCRHTIKEFGLYRYPETKPEGKESRPPVDRDNHALDSIRYCIWMGEPDERLPEEELVTVERLREWRDPGEPKDEPLVRYTGY